MDHHASDDARLACVTAVLLLAATLAERALRDGSEGGPEGGPLHLARHLVDVNAAAAGEIEAVPGIGPVLARRIVAARPFASIEDLCRVPGLGRATLAGLEGFVCCEPRE